MSFAPGALRRINAGLFALILVSGGVLFFAVERSAVSEGEKRKLAQMPPFFKPLFTDNSADFIDCSGKRGSQRVQRRCDSASRVEPYSRPAQTLSKIAFANPERPPNDGNQPFTKVCRGILRTCVKTDLIFSRPTNSVGASSKRRTLFSSRQINDLAPDNAKPEESRVSPPG